MNTPALLEKSANGLSLTRNQFNTISFISKLHFLPLSNELWDAAKHPLVYKTFAHIPNFIDTLEKLSFIVQCDLIELADYGSLSDYIDEIRSALSDSNCLDLKTRMQTCPWGATEQPTDLSY